jgi:hypothetical protein
MQILKYNRSRFHRYLFSCKNYQAKEGSCFPKVGRFFARKPTKLSLYFSVFSSIFYGFYKFQQKGFTIEDLTFKQAPRSFSSFSEMPLVCINALGNKKNLTMWSGTVDSCPASIPASSPALKTRKGRGRAPGSPGARFVPELETGAAPVS